MAAGMAGAAPESQPWLSTVSPARFYSVQGTNRDDIVALARWADSVAQRFDYVSDLKTAADFSSGCEIMIAPPGVVDATGLVVTQFVTSAGKYLQRIAIPDPARLDMEDLLETLCAVRLDAVAASRRPALRTSHAGMITPAWMGIGLAQNIFTSLRARNAKAFASLTAGEADIPDIATVLTWRHLPAGRSHTKVYSGLAIAWIISRSRSGNALEAVLLEVVDREVLLAADLAVRIDCSSSLELEEEWRNWLRRQSRIVRPGAESSASLLAGFREQLVYRPEDMQVAGATNISQALSIRDLVVRRGQPWVRVFARGQAENVRQLAIGKDREFAAVVEAFGEVYDSIANNRLGMIVNRRLRHAETALRDLEKTISARTAYLDARERMIDPPSRAAADGQHLVEKSAMRTYIDDVERRLTRVTAKPAPPVER